MSIMLTQTLAEKSLSHQMGPGGEKEGEAAFFLFVRVRAGLGTF